MTSLRSIALGLVIVMLNVTFEGYDAVADPVGWALVLIGLAGLRPHLDGTRTLIATAGLCLLVSLLTYPPEVRAGLPASVGWAVSLPQLAFAFLLCTTLAPRAGELAGRLRALRWFFAALALAPVVVLGGEVAALVGPVAVAGVLALAYLVYLLLRITELTGEPAVASR